MTNTTKDLVGQTYNTVTLLERVPYHRARYKYVCSHCKFAGEANLRDLTGGCKRCLAPAIKHIEAYSGTLVMPDRLHSFTLNTLTKLLDQYPEAEVYVENARASRISRTASHVAVLVTLAGGPIEILYPVLGDKNAP